MIRSFQTAARAQNLELELVFPHDLFITDDIEETGSTFEENSRIKAEFFYKKSGLATIADDGGIMIPALNNEPGVKTRRWLGRNDATDEEIVSYTLKRMEHLQTRQQRKAFFATCVTFYDGNTLLQEKGQTECQIAKTPLERHKTPGFPFRVLMILSNGKYFDDLTQQEHEIYDHRDMAAIRLVKRIASEIRPKT